MQIFCIIKKVELYLLPKVSGKLADDQSVN